MKRSKELQYYYDNKDRILQKLKDSRKSMTEEEKQKQKQYQRDYYKKHTKKKFENDLKNTGSNYRLDYYQNNKDYIRNKYKQQREIIKKINTKITKTYEKNIIDLS